MVLPALTCSPGLPASPGGPAGPGRPCGGRGRRGGGGETWRGEPPREGGGTATATRRSSPCRERGPPSPGSRGHQQDLVHLFLQRDPGGEGRSVRPGGGLQSSCSSSRAWRWVASGAPVLTVGPGGPWAPASPSLPAAPCRGEGRKRVLRARPPPPGDFRELNPPGSAPRAMFGAGFGRSILPRSRGAAASCPRPRHLPAVPAPGALAATSPESWPPQLVVAGSPLGAVPNPTGPQPHRTPAPHIPSPTHPQPLGDTHDSARGAGSTSLTGFARLTLKAKERAG